MALNWTMISHGRPIPLPDERIISTESNVEVTLKIPDAPPQGNAVEGGSGGAGKTLKAIGSMWLSNQRLIFVSPNITPIESLSLPHHFILSNKFEQPFFFSPYLTMVVHPSPDGGLTPDTVVEVRFPDRGMFAWVQLFAQTREAAIAKRREDKLDEALPVYVPPTTTTSTTVVASTQVGSVDDRPPEYSA